MSSTLVNDIVFDKNQRGRVHLTVNYTGTESFKNEYNQSISKKLWMLQSNFDW